ncbi:MAG TPA: energy transducer TonB [Gemmatimonadales bacterium]|nr:energy transducer TonB [Gemmatimonadales bacterium]
MTSRLGPALILFVLLPAVAAGQTRDTSTACVMDTLSVRPDTLAFAAVAPKRDTTRESAAEFAFRIEQARRVAPFVARLGARSIQDLGAFERMESPAPPTGFPTTEWARLQASTDRENDVLFDRRVGSRLWFQVDDAGKLSAARIDKPSSDSLLNVLLARAVLAADSAHALAPLPPALAHDPIDLWIALTPDPDSTTEVVLRSNVALGRRRLIVERFADADSVQHFPVEISHPKMRWPHELEGSEKTDTVTVEFDLGTDGVPELPTIHVVSAHYREFAREAVRMVAGSRFRPARRGRGPEAMMVRMSVTFIQQP